MDEIVKVTRRSLHGIAELLMAGPQHRASGTIRLKVVPGGIATVAKPEASLWPESFEVDELLDPLVGTYADLGASARLDVGAPVGLYSDGSGVRRDEVIDVDPDAARELLRCLSVGDEALRLLAPDGVPVLWPEHFDVGITVDEVNFGVSLGDGFLDEPYAYVGPFTAREGEFWNAPFGAARALREIGDAAQVAEFFAEGRRLAAAG